MAVTDQLRYWSFSATRVSDKCLLDDTILLAARTMPRAAVSSLSRCPDLNEIPVRVAPIPARHLKRRVYIGVTKARRLASTLHRMAKRNDIPICSPNRFSE